MGKIVVPKEGEEQEQWIEGVHQGIISEKLFYQVQEKVVRTPKEKKSTYL